MFTDLLATMQHIQFGMAFPRLCHVYLKFIFKISKYLFSIDPYIRSSMSSRRLIVGPLRTPLALSWNFVLWGPPVAVFLSAVPTGNSWPFSVLDAKLACLPSGHLLGPWHLNIRHTRSQLTLPTLEVDHDQAGDAKLSGSGSGDMGPVNVDLPLSISG